MGINLTSLPSVRRAAALALSLGLGAHGVGLAAPAGESFAVPTLAVQATQPGGVFELEGTAQAVRQATLAAQVGGNILQLAVKAGDRVKAGQLIARIDERDASAALQRVDAAVAQAEGVVRQARSASERTRKLRQEGFVSQAAQDNADTDLGTAQAMLRQAQAERAQAALARGYATVTAPFDGIVLATHLEAGDLAQPGRPIATVYAPNLLRAVVAVPASRVAAVRGARQVTVLLPNGQESVPLRHQLLASADPVSQTQEWRLELPSGREGSLLPGQALRVRLLAAQSADLGSALTVPGAALLRRGELTAVYVVQGSQFVLRPVRTASPHGAAQAEVVAGLRAGETIAADAVRAGLSGAVPAN